MKHIDSFESAEKALLELLNLIKILEGEVIKIKHFFNTQSIS